MGVYFRNGKNYEINKTDMVKVIQLENINSFEVRHTKRLQNNLSRFIRISKYEHLDTYTGEIKKDKCTKEKNVSNIKRALKKLEYILKNNFTGAKNELTITLTTKTKVEDYDVMCSMTNKFLQDLKEEYIGIEYVYVVEWQKDRGSWHVHIMLKDMINSNLYIDNYKVEQIWKQGNTRTEAIYEVDGLIGYMTKAKTKEKIPKYKKMYYKSRGIKNVKVEHKEYGKFKEEINKTHNKVNEKVLNIKSVESDKTINTLKTEVWVDNRNT